MPSPVPQVAAGLQPPLTACWSTVPSDWADVVAPFAASPTGQALAARIDAALAQGQRVWPAQPLHALHVTRRARVRVLIVGQDPYPGPGQAQGLAFSVPPGVKPPPSLRMILNELDRDPSVSVRARDDLHHWAEQGVLLLNAVLTVQAHTPGAHAGWGWETLTQALVQAVRAQTAPLVVMAWGRQAQALVGKPPKGGTCCVLPCNHPSPLSARRGPTPFLGNGHFGAANAFLAAHGETPIHW